MRVLVTGGAGFIGSHIVDLLIGDGHEPIALDNLSSGRRANLPDEVRLEVADIRDRDRVLAICRDVRPDWVCHQAAQMSVSRSVREPHFDADTNLLGLINVLDGAVEAESEKVVFASSGGVLYGEAVEPADESHPASPISPYGISKWAGEKYLQFYAREHDLHGVALRYSNVYGPRQNPHGEAGVVAIFCQRMLRGETAQINGDGRYVRDYVQVGDVARANLAALTQEVAPEDSAINIGTARPTDVNELAAMLRSLCGEELAQRDRNTTIPEPIHGEPRAGDLRSNLVNPARAARVLGWRPEVALEDGLRQTVAWFADDADV